MILFGVGGCGVEPREKRASEGENDRQRIY